MAFGASLLLTADLAIGASGRLDDLVGTDAPRADAHTLDAAVHLRTHRLKVRLEPTGADVVRVTDLPAYYRNLPANFTLLGHDVSPKSSVTKPQV